MEQLPAHSPLGASGAERWMNCPASVSLSAGWSDEESDHATVGTAAHALAAHCLKTGVEPWRLIGHAILAGTEDIVELKEPVDLIYTVIDKEMAEAVTTYVSYINRRFPERNQSNFWVERKFHCPTIHKLFFGTSDASGLPEPRKLVVADYKHGAGIVVEAEDNVQLKYYACGVLETLGMWDDVDEVELVIVQPRAWHFDGPIRRWTISTSTLVKWLEDELIPAMNNALVSRNTKSGEHCRFCPARQAACPQIMADVKEMEELMRTIGEDGKGAGKLTGEQLARFLDLGEVFKIARTAALKTATVRVQNGHAVPGWKLAKARSNREFKDGAEAAAKKEFGEQAYTTPELKSPSQIEELPGGEGFCARWAHKPDKGETLVKIDDARPAVNKQTKAMFQPVKKSK